jgi:hypothetical protein
MATLSQIGIAGIGNGLMMPKQKNKWRVSFVGLGGALGATSSAPNDLSLQVINFTRPSLSYEEIQLDRYNGRAYIMGKQTFEPCNLTVEDDITNRASAAITSQLESQQRLIGASGPWWNTDGTASSYKFGMRLEMLDGNETVTETWNYEGCFIQQVEWDSLDYATGEKIIINMVIRFDLASQDLAAAVTGSAIGGLLNV